jgi:branched-chain amino acid transport system permease protein
MSDQTGGSRPRQLLGELLLGRRMALLFPLLGAAVLLLFPIWSGHDAYWTRELSLIAILTLLVSGLNLSFGYAGEVQFGQVFMFALGAYFSSVLAVHGFDELIPLLLLGGILASLAGLIVAVPATRIGGWSLAMASFFLVLLIPSLLNITQGLTGGSQGLAGIPHPKLLGTPLDAEGLYVVCIVCLIVWLALFRNLVTSRYGVIFRILRESPIQAAALGFSSRRLKALAHSLGAFPAGVAGCLFGFVSQVLAPGAFGIELTIGVVAASVLGGVEAVYASVIGAAILQLGPEESLQFQEYATLIYGLFLVAAAVLLKQGISGAMLTHAHRLGRRLLFGSSEQPRVTTGSRSSLSEVDLPGPANGGGGALVVDGVSKAFGGVQAVDRVSLRAEAGAITALIGSNGSGKTTLLNLICGFNRADSGTIRLGENDLTTRKPDQIARGGVGRTFQTPSVPRGPSVLETVASGRYCGDGVGPLASILRLPRYWRTQLSDRQEAMALLECVGLSEIAGERADSLALGTRRLVEVARALCGRPRLLLLDEPASGLSSSEVAHLSSIVSAAAAAGTAVIIIEHNFQFVTDLADQAYVLHLGKLIAHGPAATIGEDPHVIESYLGHDTAPSGIPNRTRPATGSPVRTQGPPVLRVDGVVAGYGDLEVLHGVSLDAYPATVEAVLGRNGVGKSTLMRALSGEISLWRGAVSLDGRDISRRRPFRRTAMGIGTVQEGKRIFRQRSVYENLMLGTYRLKLSRRERAARCDYLMDRFPVLRERASDLAGSLSGGQQQMLAIAQALAPEPQVLLLDEPSAGLAPTVVTEVFDQIESLRDAGMTVILVEQLAEQALSVADHVTILDGGRVATHGPPGDFHDLSQLQEAYFGHGAGGFAAAPAGSGQPTADGTEVDMTKQDGG